MRPEAQCRHRAWCWEVVGFHNTRGFTVVLEHCLEQKNHEVVFGIFLSNKEKDSLALERGESHIWTAGGCVHPEKLFHGFWKVLLYTACQATAMT